MKDINIKKCLEFQECFIHDGVISPYEFAKDYKVFFPLAILGEIGGILNCYCKTIRSPHSYKDDLENEAVDVFIYFLHLIQMQEMNETINISSTLEANWDKKIEKIINGEEFYKKILELHGYVSEFLNIKEKLSDKEHYKKIFFCIKSIDNFLSGQPWQESINNFHRMAIQEFTNVQKYTPDFWYNGSCFVNFNKLLDFILDNDIELPQKRILFLERMSHLQKEKTISK
ncbi:MAG: hypothetical protein M1355_03195 [Patescibacteria group bacterium]|nr:hypothetical protein [Patescibacteria group bacterium]